jgi:hypothetical protein
MSTTTSRVYAPLSAPLKVKKTDLSIRLLGLRELAGWLFRCWHRNLSRPFTLEGETYRVCLHCGARRRFSPDSWRTVGAFYRDTTSYGARRFRSDMTGAQARNLH